MSSGFLLAITIFFSFDPEPLVFVERVAISRAIFFSEATSLAFKKVALVYCMNIEVLIPAKSIKLAIFKHSSINKVLGLKHPIAIQIPAVKLAYIDFLVLAWKEVLSISGHLSIDPLSLIPLSWTYNEFDANPILLAVAKLSLVNIAIIVSNFAYSLNLVIPPYPLKNVASFGNKFANTMLGAIIYYFALVNVTVWFVENSEVLVVDFLTIVVNSQSISEVKTLEKLETRALRIRSLVLYLRKVGLLRSLAGWRLLNGVENGWDLVV